MDTKPTKCSACKAHFAKRYCLRNNKRLCWLCCNEIRVDYKCPKECEYHVREMLPDTKNEWRSDCHSETDDYLDRAIKAWSLKPNKSYNDQPPIQLKDTPQGLELLHKALSRLSFEKKLAVLYEKHLGVNLNSKDLPYTKNHEDIAKEFLDAIGEHRWQDLPQYLYASEPVKQKILQRLKQRKELKKLNYYMILQSGTSTDGTETFCSIEINYDFIISMLFKKVEETWLVENIIFGDVNLIYSETDCYKHIGHALSKSDFRKAHQLLTQAENIYYFSADIQYYWGLYYSLQHKNKDALIAFGTASELDPTFIDPLYYQALIYYAEKNIESAKNYFLKALQINASHLNTLNFLGIIAVEEKNNAQAKEYFQKCLQIDGNFVNALYNLGNIFAQENQPETAREYYTKCLAIKPDFQLAADNLKKIGE